MKKRFNGLSRFDTIFNRLILSFVVLVVAVAIIIGIILTVQFSINYNKKIEELEEYRLSYLSDNVEAVFKDSNQIILNIINLGNQNEDIQKYLYYPMETDILKAVNILKFLKVMCAQKDSLVSSIEIYTKKNSVHISTFTGINFDANTEDIFNKQGIFHTETKYQSSKRWISHRVMTYGNQEHKVYSFAAKYPLYTEDPSMAMGYVAVNIEEDVFHKLLSDFVTGELDAVAIMNHQGEVIVVEGNTEGFYALLEDKNNRIDDIIADKSGQRNHIIGDTVVTSQSAGIEDWVIVNMVSTKEYYDETRNIQKNILYISFTAIVIGIFVSYLFARRMYRPFHLIINRLDRMKFSKKARESEYFYIDRAIEELCDRTIEKEKVLHENRNIITRDFVLNLISNKITNEKEVEDKLSLLSCNWSLHIHYVLIIKLHPKIYNHLDELTRNLLIYNMTHFFDNYSNSDTRCLSADLFDGTVCVIFSVREGGKRELAILRNKFTDYMKINFSVDTVLIQSFGFSKLLEVYTNYQRLEKLIDYLYFIPHVYFLSEEDLKDKVANRKESLDINFNLFSEALVSRDIGQIERILKEFMNEAAELTVSAEYLNGVVLEFVFLYNYFMRDIMKESKNKNDTQLFKDINELYHVVDFYFWFMKLIETTFDELSSLEENPTKTVVQLIETVIMENLEENLSLEFIAEKVFLSPKYISRIYKEERGINITQFVTECKLKKAAKMLVESNIPLEELIKHVGFSSSNYFIKKFKEKYSVTPIQYRRNSIT
ncbi:MAG: helix-turn-helix domain-containing protein [Anaerocolumna sp.]